jgi:hypothetical protein
MATQPIQAMETHSENALGRRLINSQRQAHLGELNQGGEIGRAFVVAGGDLTEVLQLGEEALDDVALPGMPLAEAWPPAAVRLGRDVRHPSGSQLGSGCDPHPFLEKLESSREIRGFHPGKGCESAIDQTSRVLRHFGQTRLS